MEDEELLKLQVENQTKELMEQVDVIIKELEIHMYNCLTKRNKLWGIKTKLKKIKQQLEKVNAHENV